MSRTSIFVNSFVIRSNDAVRVAVDRANANGNAFLTRAEATALPANLKDNYDAFQAQQPTGVVGAERFADAFVRSVARAAAAADANGDGVLTRREARALPAELRDNFESVLAKR
jgi:hypothetical protein